MQWKAAGESNVRHKRLGPHQLLRTRARSRYAPCNGAPHHLPSYHLNHPGCPYVTPPESSPPFLPALGSSITECCCYDIYPPQRERDHRQLHPPPQSFSPASLYQHEQPHDMGQLQIRLEVLSADAETSSSSILSASVITSINILRSEYKRSSPNRVDHRIFILLSTFSTANSGCPLSKIRFSCC